MSHLSRDRAWREARKKFCVQDLETWLPVMVTELTRYRHRPSDYEIPKFERLPDHAFPSQMLRLISITGELCFYTDAMARLNSALLSRPH